LLSPFDLDPDTEATVRYVHTEQAKRTFGKSVTGDDNFDSDEAGVVGIDTAEQF